MTTTAHYSLQRVRVRGLRHSLLAPGFAFAAVWTGVLLIWISVSSSTFARTTGSERYESTRALSYMGLALALFVVGTSAARVLFPSIATRSREQGGLNAEALRYLRGSATLAAGIAALVTLAMLGTAAAAAGGPSRLVSLFLAQSSWSDIYQTYFAGTHIQGLAVWVHLNLAAAPLATIGIIASRAEGISPRPFQRILILSGVVALVNGLVIQERIAIFEFVVAASVAAVGYSRVIGRPLSTPRLLRRTGVVVAMLVAVWLIGEYGRTYLPRYGPNVQNAAAHHPTLTQTAFDQFSAYVLSNPNNALYAVDHYRSPSYVYWSLNGVVTTLGLDRTDAPLFGKSSTALNNTLHELYGSNGPFTTVSLPGYAFLDLSWVGLALMFWFGVICGVCYTRFCAGTLWALLVYPLVLIGVIDSYRILYWTESRMLIPAIFLMVISRRIVRTSFVRREPAR
jgi:hypothetical protein